MNRALGLVHVQTADATPRIARVIGRIARPASSVDYQSALKGRLSALGNDRFGCCVPAGLMHAAQARMSAMMGSDWNPSEAETLRLYSALTGFDPATGTPDRGTDVDRALNYLAHFGVSINPSFQDMLHPLSVSPSATEQCLATEWFGWVGYSLALPLAAQDMTERLAVPSCGLDADAGRPGGWGAHFVVSCAYDCSSSAIMRRCVTWGQDMEITQGFIDAYLLRTDSGWSNDSLDASGHSFDGLDRDALARCVQDLA